MSAKLMMVWVLTASLTQSVYAEGPPGTAENPVRVIGDLKPQYSVELNSQDFEHIRRELLKVPQLEPFTVDVNDLYKPEDAQAIQRLKQLFLSQVLEASADLVDMKSVLYQLAARLNLREVKRNPQPIYESYQLKLQLAFNRFIGRFVREPEYREIMDACVTDLCLINVTDAITEILRFAEELNAGFEVDELEDWDFEWKFENKLLQSSLSENIETFSPRNTSTVPGYSAIALIAGGLAFAGESTLEVGEFLSQVLTAGRVYHYEIEADPSEVDFDRVHLRMGHHMGRKLEAITRGVTLAEVKNEAIRYHVNVLSCRGGREPGVHVLLAGEQRFDCTSLKEDGTAKTYNLRVFTVGPGLWISGKGDLIRDLVIIHSPVEMDPTGHYGGITLRLGVAAGVGLDIHFGPYGSFVFRVGAGVGIGALAGFSGFKIK